jgi:hypothetical protein
MRLLRILAVAVAVAAAGCSGSPDDGEVHPVKNLKARGMRGDPRDASKPVVPGRVPR